MSRPIKLVAAPAYILPAVSSASRPSPGDQAGGTPLSVASSSPSGRGREADCASPRGTAASRPRLLWMLSQLALLIPGVLLVAIAVLVALPGVVLLAVALRRLSAAPPASEPATERPQGQDDPRPRVWPAQPSREVH